MPQSLTQQLSREQQISALEKDWAQNPRWKGVKRGYSAADVVRLRGSLQPEYTLAQRGAELLWDRINGGAKKGYVNAFGAISAGQAMQQAKAGLEAVYLSGWQVAADGNTSETMYPDQSLYAYDSVPTMVRRINNTFKRADEIQWSRGINPGDKEFIDYFLPIVADAEAGFGGVLNAFELMKNMIAAGAAGVHFEDQLAAVKKCGHMGGKVLVPTQEAVEKLISARFAADVMGVPTIVLARTDAEAANLITSDHDANDKPFLTGERTQEGFYRVRNGMEQSISRGVAYAPYADLVWCETGVPDIGFAREFAQAVHGACPGKLLSYNCSPSFSGPDRRTSGAMISRLRRCLRSSRWRRSRNSVAMVLTLGFKLLQQRSRLCAVHAKRLTPLEMLRQAFAAMSLATSSMNASTDITPRSLLPRARTATAPAAFSLSPATRM